MLESRIKLFLTVIRDGNEVQKKMQDAIYIKSHGTLMYNDDVVYKSLMQMEQKGLVKCQRIGAANVYKLTERGQSRIK